MGCGSEYVLEIMEGETPTILGEIIEPDGIDLTMMSNVYFTIAQNPTKIRKDLSNGVTVIDATNFEVSLSQEETLGLWGGYAECQLNGVYADGSRAPTYVYKITVLRNLEPEVLQ